MVTQSSHIAIERENGDNRTADIALAVKRLQKK